MEKKVKLNNRTTKTHISLSEDIIQIEYISNPSKIGVILFPPDPNWGGSMHTPLIDDLFNHFDGEKFCVMRFSFVKYQILNNAYDQYIIQGAVVFEEFIKVFPDVNEIWFVGYSFGSLVSLNILLRRPEVKGIIMIAPPILNYDYFSWINLCKTTGLIFFGIKDDLTPEIAMDKFSQFLGERNISLNLMPIQGSNHYFVNKTNYIGEQIIKFIESSKIKEAAEKFTP
jgi:alpha/beta superfamily hydrolase